MITKPKAYNFFIFFLTSLSILVPVSMFSGPAAPDILLTITGVFFLSYLIITRKLKFYFYNK